MTVWYKKPLNNKTRHFNDTITVHTSPSGTQYVNPIDVFISKEQALRFIEQARAKVEEQPAKKQKQAVGR